MQRSTAARLGHVSRRRPTSIPGQRSKLARRQPRVGTRQWAWQQTATTLAGILSVLLVAVGLFYTNLANRKQQQLGLEQQLLALQGQAAGRFTTAIDQLGHEGNDQLSIRLGGVYSLQRLARDSQPDAPTVVQVLCAFVRTHAPRRPFPPPVAVPSAPEDVRAAVTVLGFRPHPDQLGNRTLDFSNALLGLDRIVLAGADLTGADLAGADLAGARLDQADLRFADLTGAYLTGVDLRGTQLGGHRIGANLRGTNLTNVTLAGVDLTGVDLAGAHLALALAGADLMGADLSFTRVYADLRHANLMA
jgi:hypothetical protein